MVWGLTGGGGAGGAIKSALVRYFSRERAVNVRKINPKVPFPEAFAISESLYTIIKQNGPLTIGNTWTLAKVRFFLIYIYYDRLCLSCPIIRSSKWIEEANVDGLSSKTHMKIMLKWMRGRKLLKLICNHVGSNKKFMHCTLPEEPQKQSDSTTTAPPSNLKTEKPILRKNKKVRS
ncbi:hypothetical protein LINPERPRIM_LOCUS8783 [Linum perenne]